jgi:glycosyltransferase involved in cell wall biosynthesis
VLFVLPDLCPSTGGPVTTVLGLARAFTVAGHDATIVATDFGANGFPHVPGVAVHLFPCLYGPRRWAPQISGFLRREVHQWDVVSIHTLWQFTTFAAGFACRRARRPYIATPHGMLDGWSLSQKRWRKQLYLWTVERHTLRGAGGLQATSEGERAKSRLERWNRSVFVVPWGVPESAYADLPGAGQLARRFPALRGRRLVLFLGRLHPKKQPEVALRAFATVCAGDSSTALVVVGPGEPQYIVGLKRLARQLDISDQVIFTGPLWGDSVREAYRAAAVFLLPSLQENFGHTVAEAMAAGCPVIVSDQVDLAPDVRAAHAGLVTPPTAEGTAEALRALLTQEAFREELGRNGKMLVRERFTWERVVGELTRVYEDILTGRRHSPAWQVGPVSGE